MASVIKVDQIQLSDGSKPTAGDLGLDTSGSVIQVAQGQYGVNENFSIAQGLSGPWCGLTGSITTKQANSKIKVEINLQGLVFESDNSYGRFQVYMNTGSGLVLVKYMGYPVHWSSTDNASGTVMTDNFISSPNVPAGTTVTFSMYFVSMSSTNVFSLQRDSAALSTILMSEISA